MYVCPEPVALHDASLYVLRRGGSGVHVHVVGVTDARSRCNKQALGTMPATRLPGEAEGKGAQRSSLQLRISYDSERPRARRQMHEV